MAKTKTKAKPKPKAIAKPKRKQCRHGDDPDKCVPCQMLAARPDKVEPKEPEPSRTFAVALPERAKEPEKKEPEKKKEPAATKFLKVYDAMTERAAYYLDRLKGAGIEARESDSRYRGYRAIEVDASEKTRAIECMFGKKAS